VDHLQQTIAFGVRQLDHVLLFHAAPPGRFAAAYRRSSLTEDYTTLGLIVQTISGESYEQYVEEHILAPLGMKNSFMFLPEAERHGLATGHQFWFGRPFPGGGLSYNRAITPTGLITSDARDMSRYLIAQLNGGHYDGVRVLSSEGIAELHRGAANMGQPDVSYAMGWIDGEMDGVPVVWHNGDTGDFHATMILVPESKWGVVVLMNGSNDLRGSMDTTANGVVARLVGVEPPPPPSLLQEPFLVALLVILAVGVLQVLGIVRSVVLLRRWRTHPARRPSGVVRVGLRVVAPLATNLLWAVILLVGLPRFVGVPLWLMAYPPSDLGLVVVLSGGIALIWGVVLRPVLALLALRVKVAPGDASTPEKARVRVPA
jgi:hypothetical protein